MTQLDPDEYCELEDQIVADERFRQFRQTDPYSGQIQPALLNSRDIHKYALQTGMICPYKYKRLKSASYSICIGNRVIYWDEKGKRQDNHLKIMSYLNFQRTLSSL